jgi:hypothetical protein
LFAGGGKARFAPPVNLLCLGVTGVRPVDALWKKTLAAALAPPCQGGASGFATHARAKSMLVFAGAFGWLESAFHNGEPAKSEGRAMLGSWKGLSMEAHKVGQSFQIFAGLNRNLESCAIGRQ